jgi:Domain of Unknown Function with PDB structure (DUF3857)/Transglutaminase-like superfamily
MSRACRLLVALVLYSLLPGYFGGVVRADDWLPVAPEDLALKDNPTQPGADAMILYRQVDVDAKLSSVVNYMRVKIFTQKGTKQGDVEIPYNRIQGTVEGIRGRTIHPDGSITEFDGKAFDKIVEKNGQEKYMTKAFTMPDVQPGSIIEYRYREQLDDKYYWSIEWIVQSQLFTRLARFSIKQSDSMYAPLLVFREYGLPPQEIPKSQGGGSYSLEIHDLPGIEEENYMLPLNVLMARVEFFYMNPGDPANESTDQYWKRISKKWTENLDHFASKGGAVSAEVSKTVAANDPPEVKLRKIYARVLQVRNLSMESSKSEQENKAENLKPNANAEDVLKRGAGNARDINFLFIAMARAAGFEATSIYLAPRNNSIFTKDAQDSRQLGADVVWVKAGGQEYYLDPGARFYRFGLLPWYEAGANGLRLGKQNADFVNTPGPGFADAVVTRHADINIRGDGGAEGKIQIDFAGQEAALLRRDNRDEDDTGRKKALEDKIKEWLPAGAEFEVSNIANWDDVEQPVRIDGTVKITSTINAVNRRMLMPVELFRNEQISYFEAQKRMNDIYFPYPYQEADDLVFHLGGRYKADSMPAAQKVDRGAAIYEMSATLQGDDVEVKRSVTLKSFLFEKQVYPALRGFFSVVKTNDDAQVLLQNSATAKNN